MRWILRIAGILAVAWLLFLAAPFVALHNFAREVEARDIEAIRDRVNFRAVRISLLKQVMGVVVQEKGRRAIDPGSWPSRSAQALPIPSLPSFSRLKRSSNC